MCSGLNVLPAALFFFNISSFILWEFHFMHPYSAHFLGPLYPPLISATHPHIRRQIKVTKQDNKGRNKNSNLKQNKSHNNRKIS